MRSLLKSCTYVYLLLGALPVGVLGGNILSTNGFSTCIDNPTVKVKTLNVQYDRITRMLTFDVAGESTEIQNVTANLIVSAYGREVYNKTINPCAYGMPQMCPLPAASFASFGNQTIPSNYASQIPSIAFSVPDLDGDVKMQLTNDQGQDVACIQSNVSNGRTLNLPAVTYVAAGIAAAALAFSAIAGIAAGGHPGATTSSPTFTEVIGWFQGIATNGMLSVQYPQVYQSFTSNFGFSTGLISWGSLQIGIDNFRAKTGGNLTDDSYQYLKNNATLVYQDGSNSTSNQAKRALNTMLLFARDGTQVTVNGTSGTFGGSNAGNATADSGSSKDMHFVHGIQAYVEQLTIPQANTFMTVLLVFAILIGVIIVGILLIKVVLEAWGMFGSLPKSLESWRKRYWWRLAKAITNLIILLYGVWTLYCIYQFTNGDSWAAKLLAGLTLAIFTAVLAWFTWRIYTKAHESKGMDGSASKLYEDKETWVRYSLFYDNYKRNYWLFFVPAIIYMFAKGCVIAGANGHGLAQTAGQLVVEALMLALVLWTRPYQLKSGRWINVTVHVVRVMSVACILVFVEELGISQTTKTITGVVLIALQCGLTGILAILIAVNALIVCIKENPHRKQRKAAEKMNRDIDNLTPLDARNSLLMEPMVQRNTEYKSPVVRMNTFGDKKGYYGEVPRAESPAVSNPPFQRTGRFDRVDDREYLVSGAASMGRRDESASRSPPREPRLPDLDFGFDHAR